MIFKVGFRPPLLNMVYFGENNEDSINNEIHGSIDDFVDNGSKRSSKIIKISI